MSVTLVGSPTVLQFTLWGNLCQRIFDWAYALDEMVFREQLETGSFRGRWEVDEAFRRIMELINAQGQIAPYYGLGGNRGVCVYTFRPRPSRCLVRVDHSVTEEWIEDDVPVEPLAAGVEPEVYIRFQIVGAENTTLHQWEHWVDEFALSSRYSFHFGIVGMGSGYTVKVTDHHTNTLLDATDYDAW
jgi:hypothetical protein